jgi:DNA-binding phage protein
MARNQKNPKNLRVNPLVRELFQIMYERDIDFNYLANKSGVSRETISRWQHRTQPTLETFVACLNAMDCDLKIKR